MSHWVKCDITGLRVTPVKVNNFILGPRPFQGKDKPLHLPEPPNCSTRPSPTAQCLTSNVLLSLPHLPWSRLTLSLVSCQLGLSDLGGKLLYHRHVVVDLGCFSLALHNQWKNEAAGKDRTWKIQHGLGAK